MITIILPGYSARNKDWADETARELKLAHKIIVHNWHHWETGGNMSVKQEMHKIREELSNNNFNIIAKSVGARMAIRVVSELNDQVSKVILCGIASISEDNKKAYIKALSNFPHKNIICFQNTNDPFVPYSDVKKFMDEVNIKINKSVSGEIKVIEKPGSEHHYPYTEDFQKFLK